MTSRPARLLDDDEPPPYTVVCESGSSPFFLTCDHAGRIIPRRLQSLGLPDTELQRHIAWDIGAAGVTVKLAALLDAFAILQTYSRLVIDCNRPLVSPTSIATLSEHTVVPGNLQLSNDDAEARAHEIFWPYHRRIVAELDARAARNQPTVLITVHSFTPVFKGDARAMHAGVLYNRDSRLAHRLLDVLRENSGLIVGDNQPYSVSDHSDYAIPVYGEQRGLLHAEIEIRQDLIADDAGQQEWAARLATALRQATIDLL
jgi:predicted N-formylglutamate amidohydrolase